jgi:hypothetical protein
MDQTSSLRLRARRLIGLRAFRAPPRIIAHEPVPD